jgi:hypothetical protein
LETINKKRESIKNIIFDLQKKKNSLVASKQTQVKLSPKSAVKQSSKQTYTEPQLLSEVIINFLLLQFFWTLQVHKN